MNLQILSLTTVSSFCSYFLVQIGDSHTSLAASNTRQLLPMRTMSRRLSNAALDRTRGRERDASPNHDLEAESLGQGGTRSLLQPDVLIPTFLCADMSFEQKVKNQIMVFVKGKNGPWITWVIFPNDMKDDIWNNLL